MALAPIAGDILSLVERAEASIKDDEAKRVTERLMAAKFDFNDFLAQFKMMNNMGSMGAVMKMLPGEDRHTIARSATFCYRCMPETRWALKPAATRGAGVCCRSLDAAACGAHSQLPTHNVGLIRANS